MEIKTQTSYGINAVDVVFMEDGIYPDFYDTAFLKSNGCVDYRQKDVTEAEDIIHFCGLENAIERFQKLLAHGREIWGPEWGK